MVVGDVLVVVDGVALVEVVRVPTGVTGVAGALTAGVVVLVGVTTDDAPGMLRPIVMAAPVDATTAMVPDMNQLAIP